NRWGLAAHVGSNPTLSAIELHASRSSEDRLFLNLLKGRDLCGNLRFLRRPRPGTGLLKRRLDLVKRMFFMALGAFIVVVALDVLLVPNRIIDGGITGVSIMLEHLTRIPLGYYLFFLNLPFLVLGYKTIGKTFALSTLFAVAALSASTFLLH